MDNEIEELCPKCGKTKEYIDKPLCFSCWKATQRTCVRCGKIINGELKYYKYCQHCYSKMLYN